MSTGSRKYWLCIHGNRNRRLSGQGGNHRCRVAPFNRLNQFNRASRFTITRWCRRFRTLCKGGWMIHALAGFIPSCAASARRRHVIAAQFALPTWLTRLQFAISSIISIQSSISMAETHASWKYVSRLRRVSNSYELYESYAPYCVVQCLTAIFNLPILIRQGSIAIRCWLYYPVSRLRSS